MFQLETEMFRVEGHSPRDILDLISDAVHADDAVWACTVGLIGDGGRSSFFSIHDNLLTDVTPLHHYYGAVRPCSAHQYFRSRGSSACAFFLRTAE